MTVTRTETPPPPLRGPAALRTFYRPRTYGNWRPAAEPSPPAPRRHVLAPLLAVALLLLAASAASASRLPPPKVAPVASPVQASVSPSRGLPYTRFDAAAQPTPTTPTHVTAARGPARP